MKLVSMLAALILVGGCHAQLNGSESAAAPVVAEQQNPALLPLTIQAASGRHAFRVEVARTDEEQAQGLMFRTSLPDDGGMLFPFDPVRPASFWMKNTVISLDLLFVRADGSIARIAANAVPYSLDPIVSGEPVKAVLELAGGKAAALGIAEGDHVSWAGGPDPVR